MVKKKKKMRREPLGWVKPVSLSLSSRSNVSNNDSGDEFHHESYSQAVRVCVCVCVNNRQQQEPAATSKGRSTSRHSTRGTYDNHVTHFLHDNVTVEFHYWRIDWGIAGAANLSVGGHERRPSKKRWFTSYTMHDRVQINVHDARFSRFPIRHRHRFLPYRFTIPTLSSYTFRNDWLFRLFHFQLSKRDTVGSESYHRVNFSK